MVGNIMIDAFELQRPQIDSLGMAARFGVDPGTYGVVTLHRPSNVDDPANLKQIIGVLTGISRRLPLVFAVHPRTRARLQEFGLMAELEQQQGNRLSEP
jgi:UDP-N-acetylglucosamine 2-epimerase (non-hydrolysing)